MLGIPHLHQKGITGSGVGVAILDTGAYPHQDLPKFAAFADFVNTYQMPYDDSGHGTHVAGIVASRRFGIAPACRLFILKVLDARGEGKTSGMLQGIDWIIKHKDDFNIRIVNISIGTLSKKNQTNQALLDAVSYAWDCGLVVVSAAGNLGPSPMSITTPGIHPKIITVGACDDTASQRRQRAYSGRGPTPTCVCKPEVVAPGSRILSCKNQRTGYRELSGTSMSTPFVSGVLALLLSREPNLTPKDVKLRLYETCIDMELPHQQQGWGLINPRGLLHV
jgi:serine protease AprX